MTSDQQKITLHSWLAASFN